MKRTPLVLALSLSVVLIGLAMLNRRSHKVVTSNNPNNVPQAVQPAPNNAVADAHIKSTDVVKQNTLVDKRGKGQIKPEEVFEAESLGGEIELDQLAVGAAVLGINVAELDRQDEVGAVVFEQISVDGLELCLEFFEPGRMRKIPGTEKIDPY